MKNNTSTYADLRARLRRTLSLHRFNHSVRVGELAARLGKLHGWDPARARLAGLLHDCVKEWNTGKLKKYVKKHHLPIPDLKLILETSPNMLHAYVGADFVRRKGWIKRSGDVNAIRSHTLGSKKMSLEEKILYIADMAEPGRPYPAARSVRFLAKKNIDAAFREALAHKIGHQLRKGKPLFPHAIHVWNKVVCRTRHT